MSLDERARHELFVRLEDVLGADAASTLMEHLPPTGWADVATKRDLDHLETTMKVRFEAVDARFEAVDARFDSMEARLLAEIRAMGAQTLRANLALLVACIGLVFAAVRFGGT